MGILMLAIVACAQGEQMGFLEGSISIGPLCPVESIPPDPQCQPTQETFNAWKMGIWKSDKLIGYVEPSVNGAYKMELRPGTYTVDFIQPQFGGANLPATVQINPGRISKLDINIDTGIR